MNENVPEMKVKIESGTLTKKQLATLDLFMPESHRRAMKVLDQMAEKTHSLYDQVLEKFNKWQGRMGGIHHDRLPENPHKRWKKKIDEFWEEVRDEEKVRGDNILQGN